MGPVARREHYRQRLQADTPGSASAPRRPKRGGEVGPTGPEAQLLLLILASTSAAISCSVVRRACSRKFCFDLLRNGMAAGAMPRKLAFKRTNTWFAGHWRRCWR